jgi:hypothetical protein
MVPLEGLGQLKTSSDIIGNQTRDLPACSIVPQPIMLPRTPNAGDNTSIYAMTDTTSFPVHHSLNKKINVLMNFGFKIMLKILLPLFIFK